MLKIIPNSDKWQNNSLQRMLYFYVGVNPKNDKTYIRCEERVLRSIKPHKRVLLSNFNETQYALIITNSKLVPLPKYIKGFLHRIAKNKKLIERAVRIGVEELVI
jgi:hypothetical protein